MMHLYSRFLFLIEHKLEHATLAQIAIHLAAILAFIWMWFGFLAMIGTAFVINHLIASLERQQNVWDQCHRDGTLGPMPTPDFDR